MSKLIDYLESINLLSEQELWDYICENDIETLDTLIIYLRRLIDEDFQILEYTPFTFVPNADISGTGGCNEMNILVARNRKSGNLEIGVPVLGNRLFCAWLLVHFYVDISQGLAVSAVRSSLY